MTCTVTWSQSSTFGMWWICIMDVQLLSCQHRPQFLPLVLWFHMWYQGMGEICFGTFEPYFEDTCYLLLYTCSTCSSSHDWQFAWLCWWGGHRVTAQCRAVSSLVTGLSSLGWSYSSLWLCSPLFLGSTLSSVEAKLAHAVNILHWAAAVKKEELSLSSPSHLLTWCNFRGTSEHRSLFLPFSQIWKTSPWSCWRIISEALEVLRGWICSSLNLLALSNLHAVAFHPTRSKVWNFSPRAFIKKK